MMLTHASRAINPHPLIVLNGCAWRPWRQRTPYIQRTTTRRLNLARESERRFL